ncbi:hypothetical protein Avbf_09828 [Armadillidium vulgare]|nr:hypothetical protein Avbf_09828 [Armadillidium vulgare]
MGHLIKNILEYFFIHIKHMKKYLKIIQLRKEKNKEELEQIVPKNSYDISKMQTLTKTDMKS